MASTSSHFIILCSLLFLSTSLAKTPPRPKSLVLPITKDPSTNQYITHIQQRTPLTTVSLTVNLGGKFLWTNCETGYTSSSIRPGGCGTPQCRLAKAFKDCESCTVGGPACSNTSTCWTFVANLLIPNSVAGQLAYDIFSVNSTDGNSPGTVFSVPEFLFYCGSNDIMRNLAQGVTGMAGLGRTQISIPFQVAKAFRFQKKFTLCLSPSTRSKGFVLIGDGQYTLPPLSNVSTSLTYTPLFRDPSTSTADYYIGIKSIKINEKQVPINTTLLSISSKGQGGTVLSTLDNYTILETSIHNAVVKAFVSQLPKATRVAPVAPFAACFRSSSIGSTSTVGPAVPPIDLVFDEEEKVFWRIYGANSMVQVTKDVMCLGVVDTAFFTYGFNPSIVIGGHQMEDNLLEFDDGKSRFGFSSSLLLRQTACANLKYTSN